MSSILQSLQAKQLVWQGKDLTCDINDTVDSGFELLNQKLGGGWPKNGVVEIQCQHQGIGEVRLLLPTLAQLYQQDHQQSTVDKQRLIFWVSPPGRLNPQSLVQFGLPLANTLVADDVNEKQAFWLCEQAMRSGCCANVILWCEALDNTQAKRLQLAAKDGKCLAFILRPPTQVMQSLPVSVRMQLDAHQYGLSVNINKRLGGTHCSRFTLDMRQYWPLYYPQPYGSNENTQAASTNVTNLAQYKQQVKSQHAQIH